MDIPQANQTITRLDTEAEHRSAAFDADRVMRWRIFGSSSATAAPLVLIHGGHGNWLHWIRNIETLSRDRRIYVVDLPGYGDSDDPPELDASVQIIAGFVITALDTLFARSQMIDLAGFSYGGLVSAYIAAQRGAVRRLALLGSPGSETPARRTGEMQRWRNADAAGQEAALRNNLLAHMMYAPKNVDALAFRAYADGVRAARFRGRGMAHGVPLNTILTPYHNPVLFLYGEHDVICQPEQAKVNLSNAAARRECRLIAGSGHWVALEGADDVNDALVAWFGAEATGHPAESAVMMK
jgi:2-hydroxy-6-oxonona-2,4-dienedioate hydrolase